MPRRIEVELTSTRDDGTWTWRAAGARQPKGTLDGSLLYDGAKVGDVVRADADFDIEGITITGVLPPKEARQEPERLEILGRPVSEEQLVTSTLAPKRRGDRRDRRGDGDDRPGRGRPRRERGERSPAGEGRERRPRPERRPRAERPAPEPKPKPKRLRPGRAHRSEVLASLPEEERPIAEQVLRGGIPAVRQAVEKQNEQATAEGRPQVKAEPLVAIAERLLPRLRTAEWRDRADAAVANIDELDLRELRSVVVAADTAARDEESRALAESIREGLNRRVEAEHAAWLDELGTTLREGRVVRALRLSSRPPKAGAPLPPDLAGALATAAGEALAADVTQERWATVLDAIAYSPVRQQVTPAAVPEQPGDELLAAVRKLASRVPEIAARFGVTPSDAPARGRRGGRRSPGRGTPPPVPPPPARPTTDAETPTEAAPEATPEPVAEAAPEATPEPVAEAAPEATPEPVAETPAEAAPEAASEPAADTPAETSAAAADVADAVESAIDEAAPAAEPEGPDDPDAQPSS